MWTDAERSGRATSPMCLAVTCSGPWRGRVELASRGLSPFGKDHQLPDQVVGFQYIQIGGDIRKEL